MFGLYAAVLVLRFDRIYVVGEGGLKLCVTRIENSPDGGGAIARGILDMGKGFR